MFPSLNPLAPIFIPECTGIAGLKPHAPIFIPVFNYNTVLNPLASVFEPAWVDTSVRSSSVVCDDQSPAETGVVVCEVVALQQAPPTVSSISKAVGENGVLQQATFSDVLSQPPGDLPQGSELLYTVEGKGLLMDIPVYNTCLAGTCSCTHLIASEFSQLKPCRFASYISGRGNVCEGRPVAKFIWEGVVQGFKIVDDNCDTSYNCRNYKTILEGDFLAEMC